MWTFGWGLDYADENNWLGDVLWCERMYYYWEENLSRPCSGADDLITEARLETNPEVRKALYLQIEYDFFGYGGEFPIAPIVLRIDYVARHAWLERMPALFGGEQWYSWRLDVEVYN